jgi:hypothetical protein
MADIDLINPDTGKSWQDDDSHLADCAQRVVSAAECTCGKADALNALNTYEVTVEERSHRKLTKTFRAKDLDDARHQAEQDTWTEEDGWTDESDERADQTGITKIENDNDPDDIEETYL